MTDDVKATDRLYYAIAALPGWDNHLHRARDFNGSDVQFYVGSLLSSVILAGGEDEDPIAVAGSLNDEGQGELTVVYKTHLVRAVVISMVKPKHQVKVTLHPLDTVADISVSTAHVYYRGASSTDPRFNGIRVEFSVAGERVVLERARFGRDPLTEDAAIFDALEALRRAVLKN